MPASGNSQPPATRTEWMLSTHPPILRQPVNLSPRMAFANLTWIPGKSPMPRKQSRPAACARKATGSFSRSMMAAANTSIEDAPAGLPLNTALDSYLAVHGFLKDGQLHWDNIQYFPAGSGGGGGGGGGTGFYKLNLSGTPVPFPTPTAQAGTPAGPYEYTVVEGDTCASIATTFNVSIMSIISENNLSSDCLIAVGQALKVT